jgi:hypothetical protein
MLEVANAGAKPQACLQGTNSWILLGWFGAETSLRSSTKWTGQVAIMRTAFEPRANGRYCHVRRGGVLPGQFCGGFGGWVADWSQAEARTTNVARREAYIEPPSK